MNKITTMIPLGMFAVLIAILSSTVMELILSMGFYVFTGDAIIPYPNLYVYSAKGLAVGYLNLVVIKLVVKNLYTAEDYESSLTGRIVNKLVPIF